MVVALVGWSAVMWIAERVGKRDRRSSLNLKDAVIIGLVQCVALIPGVSRSVATISARLLRDLDRVAATRLAFFSPFRLWLPPGRTRRSRKPP